MARKTKSKGSARARREARFTPKLLPLAVATATGVMAGGAVAEETGAAAGAQGGGIIEEVLVTGFRRSLQDAMRIKRDSDLIVEAISAEDIGKLPDNSIAEALTRLTGLAGQRLNGRQQLISIRGLSADFSTALLNGRQQVSAGDNRGVEFDQYPSELLGGVVVYKTPAASLTGQGLAGTVDMQTVSPLDYGDRTVAAQVRYEWNEVDALNPDANDNGQRVSLSYIDQFNEDTVGIALGYAHINSPSQREVMDVWGYNAGYGPAGGALLHTGGAVKAQSGELKRDSVVGIVQFEPNDNLSSKVDLFYSEFNETTLSREFAMPLFPNWFGWMGASLDDFTVEDGVVNSATFSGIKPVLGNNRDKRDAELWAVGWNLEASLGERWSAEFDVSYSAIDRTDFILQTNSGTGSGPFAGAKDTINLSVGDNNVPMWSSSLDYSDPSLIMLTSPMSWGGNAVPGGQVGYVNRRTIDDELMQVRLSAERYFDGFISSVEVGVQYDERTKSHVITDENGFLGFADGSLSQPFTPEGLVDTPYGLPAILTYDPLDAYNSGIYFLRDNYHGGVLSNDWEVDEQVTLGYVQFGISAELGPIPVTGNFGIQIVHTDQSSTGTGGGNRQSFSAEEAGVHMVSGGKKYTEYLPSLNLNFEIGEQKFIRFGAARTLARARMDEMRASRSVAFNAARAASTDISMSPWGGSGGNPELKPWVANAVDLSFEWYFPDGLGYFALAGFYKDLRTWVYDQPLVVDFSGYPTGGVTPVLSQGLVNRPQNGDGGDIMGLEFALQVSAEMISPALEGFGAVFNASLTDSEVERGTGDPNTPLPGLSEEVVNLTLFYEKGGFSARVSGNYRSDFLGEVSGFGASRNLRSIATQELLDAQVSYSFESGRLDGLTVFAQGTNLTDEPFYSFLNGDEQQVKDYQVYGRTFFVGLSYRY